MVKLTKFFFFVRWLLQKQSHLDPKQLQVFALAAIIMGFLFRRKPLLFLGVAYLFFNYLIIHWEEYKSRHIYENYLKSFSHKEKPEGGVMKKD